MNITARQAIEIAEKHKAKFPKLYDDVEIVHTNPQYQPQFNVVGLKAWIITGQFKLFEEIEEIWFVISDETAKVEYVFDKHNNRWGNEKV